ncbi:MAG: Ca-activated chloride channel family protein [Verrucomicrobiales bacterium]|jgi:Ca-activated chloride channel family protein
MIAAALNDYRFAAPWWLLLLLLIPLLALLRGAKGRLPSIAFSSLSHLRGISGVARAKPGSLLPSLFYGSLACYAFALARPQHISTHEQVKASGIEIVLAMDLSLSMGITDFNIGGKRVNRLAAAKRVTRQFIDGRPNDRIGLVAFAGRPYVPCPLTLDHAWLKQSLDRLELGVIEQGTAIGSAIGAATARLDQRESRSKIVVLITDGASNSGNLTPQDAARIAKTLKIKVYPIAVGTPGMHQIPLPGTNRKLQARQEFDTETLNEVASISDGKSYMAEDTDALEAIFKTIDQLEKTEIFRRTTIKARDVFHWFLWPAVLLTIISLILRQTLLRSAP